MLEPLQPSLDIGRRWLWREAEKESALFGRQGTIGAEHTCAMGLMLLFHMLAICWDGVLLQGLPVGHLISCNNPLLNRFLDWKTEVGQDPISVGIT